MNDLIKQKNMLMSSIMKNKKLAKQFSDALAAPIGSTKRENIKSTLSIMKKVSGVKNDGQGGPVQMPWEQQTPQTGTTYNSDILSSNNSTPSFSNLMVFPAAPSFKTPTPTPNQNVNLKLPPTLNNDNGLNGGGNVSENNSFSGIKLLPGSSNIAPNLILPKTVLTEESNPFSGAPIKTYDNYVPPQNKSPIGDIVQNPTTPEAIKALQVSLNTKNAGQLGWTPLTPDGIMGPKTKAAQTFTPSTLPKTNTPIINTPSGNTFAEQLYGANNLATNPKPLKIYGNTTNADLSTIKSVFASQESGDNYNSPDSVAGAMGKYQLMPFNLGYAGLSDTPANRTLFKSTPALQDKAFDAMMGDLYTKYNGDIVKIAAAYYGGAGAAQIVGTSAGNSPQKGGPSINQYVSEILQKIPNIGLADTSGSNSGTLSLANGPYSYGSSLAKANFGGRDLTQVINDNTAAYKKELEPLEIQLSNLKSESEAFIPTLTSYMEGKDKYSKAIDSMIKSAEDSLLTTNMADPFTANQYNNNLTYLYTLKGRQNARYGTYLNSAISDYNADVTKMESNYNTFKANATELLNNQNTIDQATYNDIMTRGSEEWTALDNASIKALNAGILKQQYYQNGGDAVANGLASTTNTNPKFLEDKAKYLKDITIDKGVADNTTGNLDLTKIGPGGLINLYEQIAVQGGDQRAMTEAIRIAMAATLSTSGNDPKKVAEIQKLITQLRDSAAGYDDAGKAEITAYADSLSSGISDHTSTAYSGYIETNIAAVKQAMKDLVQGSGWIFKSKPGIQDKAKWKADHSSLDSDFLEALYNTINTNIGEGTTYATNPMGYVDQVFSGKTDKENADNLAKRIAVSS